MAKEKRDPVTHRTKSQKRANNKKLHAEPGYKAKDAARHRARYKMKKAGKVTTGDGKDVNHKKAIKSGGSNAMSNLNVQSTKKNRATSKKKARRR